MKRKKGWLPVFLLPAVALFLLIYAVPLVIVFVSSLFDYRLTGDSMTFIGLQNYTQLFSDATFRQACGHTVVWILIHCIIHVSIGVILALVLYKKPRGWKFVDDYRFGIAASLIDNVSIPHFASKCVNEF